MVPTENGLITMHVQKHVVVLYRDVNANVTIPLLLMVVILV